MIKAKVIKLNTLPGKDEKDMFIKSGDIFKGKFKNWPNIGSSFVLFDDNENVRFSNSIVLSTTEVVEIISDREFRTKNSIYKIVTLEDERDERIKIILE